MTIKATSAGDLVTTIQDHGNFEKLGSIDGAGVSVDTTNNNHIKFGLFSATVSKLQIELQLFDKDDNLVASCNNKNLGADNDSYCQLWIYPTAGAAGAHASDGGADLPIRHWSVDMATFATGKIVYKASGTTKGSGGDLGILIVSDRGSPFIGGQGSEVLMRGSGLVQGDWTFTVADV